MEQSPSRETNSYSASQDTPRLLWNRKVRYRTHNSLSLAPALSQMHPVHIFTPYLSRFHSNMILSSTPMSSQVVSSLRIFRPTFLCTSHLSHVYYMSRPSRILSLVTLIKFGEAYKLRSSLLCSIPQPPITFSLLGPIFFSAPCSQTTSVCVPPLV